MHHQLIVPISTEAWVVNENVLTTDPDSPQKNFRRWGLNFNNLEFYGSPMPAPFSNEDPFYQHPDKFQGVYLHWTLPKGLRHAQHDEIKNTMTFPPLPNRWLITRYYGPKTKRSVSAWVIESDFYGDKGTSPYPDPTRTGGTVIGRCTPLQDWKAGSPSNYLPTPLTAVSSGDIHFLAYQHYNQNVFSFHDNLIASPEIKPIETLSYSITGWYASPDQDPLAAGNPEQYQWQTTAEDTTPDLHRSLYQGRVWGIEWSQAGKAPVSSETPDSKSLQVAVGANGLEALAALVAQNNPNLIPTELLTALNQGLLEKLEESDGPEDIQQHAHRGEFASHSGGFTWAVCSKGGENSDFEASVLALNSEQAKLLDELNSQQVNLNTQKQLLASMQWNLYALWWKRGKASELINVPSDKAFAAAILVLQQQIGDKTKTCQQSSDQLAATHDALAKTIEPKVLKKRMQRPFWRPQDPVILVTGIIPPKFAPDDKLWCRFNNQTITGITDGKFTVTSDMVNTAVSPVDLSALPSEIQSSVQQLLIEGCFLDPTNADSLAPLAFIEVPKLTSIMKAHDRQLFQGQLPPLQDLSAWTQPWSPLFCEWQVRWYSAAFPNWAFDQQHDHAYHLQTLPDTKELRSQSIGGHSLMTAQVSFALKGQLKRILKQDPILQKKFDLENLLKIIDDWRVLSLTLSGFHDVLTQRNTDLNRIPHQEDKTEQPIRLSMGQQCHSTPIPGIPPHDLKPPPSDFQAVRHGQFYLTGLSIVDRFGQAIDMIFPNNQEDALNFKPIRSETLLPDVDSEGKSLTVSAEDPLRFIQLTPRIIQNSRLDIDWVSAQDDKRRLLTSCQQNPIVGWLLPNYLEQAIQVYDPQGYCLGELQKTVSITNPLIWRPYPLASGSTDRVQSPAQYTWLAQMLQFLMKNSSSYDELNEVLDLALSSKVTPNSQYAHYTAALIGRPIALARCRWQLQLEQPAYQDQSWRYTLKKPSAPNAYVNYNFPIKLGNVNLNKDGLIGYFTDSNFNRLYSDFTPDNPSYVQSNYVFNLKPQNPDINSPQMTTVLMEPLSAIHAYSDILPMHNHLLPEVFVKSALNRILVTFKLGPLLTTPQLNPSIPTQIKSMRFFKPSVKGQWSWYDPQLDEKSQMRWQPVSIQPADKVPRFETTPTLITEGLLQLSQISFDQPSTQPVQKTKEQKYEKIDEQKTKTRGEEKSGPGLLSLIPPPRKKPGKSEKSVLTNQTKTSINRGPHV